MCNLIKIIIIAACLLSFSYQKVHDEFFNELLEQQNPSSVSPPGTDKAGMQAMKYPFAFAQTSIYSGGWTRQVTARDLIISTELAAVQTHLNQGGIRELHWHIAAEWGYVIYGCVRLWAVDDQGRAFVDDLKQGDFWFFPPGVPHSVEGTGDDGALILAVFNDGNFDLTTGTFLLLDWINHIPIEVLAENCPECQADQDTFNNTPKEALHIFEGNLPGPLEAEREEATKANGPVPQSFAFHADQFKPNVTRAGGQALIIDADNFPVTQIASAIVTLHPGGLRELHWHPNEDEWQYYIVGKAQMGVFGEGGMARTTDFQAGDLGYVQKSFPHYIKNTGDKDLVYLEVFATSHFEDVSLAQWLANTPSALVDQHIHTGLQFIKSISTAKTVIEP